MSAVKVRSAGWAGSHREDDGFDLCVKVVDGVVGYFDVTVGIYDGCEVGDSDRGIAAHIGQIVVLAGVAAEAVRAVVEGSINWTFHCWGMVSGCKLLLVKGSQIKG